MAGGWSLEAGVFGGAEPDGSWDFSNASSFGDSYSARLTRRVGSVNAWGAWPLEVAASWARITEDHHGEGEARTLVNGQVRVDRGIPGRHQPYLRGEWATRPEYRREAAAGAGFFRYDHDAHISGSTRWAIVSAGYGFTARNGGVSIRPFIEGQFMQMAGDDGRTSAAELFGDTRAWGVTVGARLYLGGDAMRMGTYGVLDPMTLMNRSMAAGTMDHAGMH